MAQQGLTPLEQLKLIWSKQHDPKHQEGNPSIIQVPSGIEWIECEPGDEGRCTGLLTVTRPLANVFGALHGGALATIVDHATSYAVLARTHFSPDTLWSVSVSLSVEYCAPARVGETVRIVVRAPKVGKKLAFTTATISSQDGSRTLYTGTHIKAFVPAPTEPYSWAKL
mmetsp:Transcript_14109/g.44412  ORF Transcript_14109/g.44412 Transcript_14109/m.44412 type:complete len:169 (-) Transcript_14109:607-1113(-)